MSIEFCGAKMWKDISYMIATKFFRKIPDTLSVAIFGEFICPLVAKKPLIASQPSMGQPQSVVSTIVSTIEYVLPWSPQVVYAKGKK
jgi:hypothetical protein